MQTDIHDAVTWNKKSTVELTWQHLKGNDALVMTCWTNCKSNDSPKHAELSIQ